MKDRINQLKISIVEASYNSGEGHIPSAFSILDILVVLYDKVLKFNPKNPIDPKRDRFVLSKGHGSLGLYAILADKGFFHKKHLKSFGKFEGILGGHPDSLKVPGVEVSTGSLGHGFPTAVGMAIGMRITLNKANVYAIIGDGESNEGTVWEGALLASHHKLDNLICIVDHNHSTDRAVSVSDIASKFKSFDWVVIKVSGHNQEEIYQALKTPHIGQPLAIIAETIKGYGSKTMEGNPAWHHKAPTKEEYENLVKELSS
ncbi:MAG: transketolase [Minisyncoccia bacterium]